MPEGAGEQWGIVDDVEAPADTQPAGSHVVDYELQKLISQGWQKYVGEIRNQTGDTLATAIKECLTTYAAECHGGDKLRRGVRAVSRSRRSYVLEEALWQADTEEVVARARIVMLGIDRNTGRAGEIGAAFWSAVEAREGRTIESPAN